MTKRSFCEEIELDFWPLIRVFFRFIKHNYVSFMVYIPPYEALVYRKMPQGFAPSLEVAACYCECRGRLLFLKRSMDRPQKNTWGIPAGKVEFAESALQAVCREVLEEVRVRVNESQLRDMGKLYVRYPHLDFIYHMFYRKFEDFPYVELSEEHQEYRWTILEEAFKMPLISGGREALLHFQILRRKSIFSSKGFYFIRSGAENEGLLKTCREKDSSLSERGRLQASSLCDSIASLSLKTIVFSPLRRAKETKDILTRNLDLRALEMESFIECSRDVWEAMLQFEKGRGYEVSESLENFFFRIASGANISLDRDGTVLIVAHAGVYWAMCYHMMIESHIWRIENGELVYFQAVDKGKRIIKKLYPYPTERRL